MRHSCIVVLLLVSAWLAAGCRDTTVYSAEGTIEKLDSVSLVLTDSEGSRTFLTGEARITGAGELIHGSPARVTWQGAYRKGRETAALEVWVNPVYASLLGRWVEHTPDYHQGFELRAGGTAYGVGMSTVKVSQWELPDPDHLWMMGVILGSGENTVFEDTFEIEKLTADSLVLRDGDYTMRLLHWTSEREAARRALEAEQAEAPKTGKQSHK